MSARSKIVKALVAKLNEITSKQNLSIAGSAVPTFGSLISELNNLLKGATASLDGNNDLRVTNTSTGSDSKIGLRDIGSRRLFSSLSGYSKIKNAVDGTDPTNGYQRVILDPSSTKTTDPTGLNTTKTYTATITVDGVAQAVSLAGSNCTTYNTLVNELNTNTSGCTAKFVGSTGEIQIKSNSTGATSSISITDTGTNKLFYSLADYDSIATAVAGQDATAGYRVVELTGSPTTGSATGLKNLDTFVYMCEVTVPNVYKSDLYQNVTDKLVFWDEIVDFPYVGITAGNETREYLPASFKWGYLTLTIRMYVQEDNPVEALENMLYEVEKKIEEHSDLEYESGIRLADLRIISITTDEGLLAPIGVGEIQLQAQYEI